MMPWFIWKGKNSFSDFGLWINKLPKRIRAEERHEEIEIPGRAGSLLMLEGEDVYASFSSEITMIARNTLPMDKIMEWLRGSSDFTLYNDTDRARPGRIVGEVAFERIGNNLMQAVVPFVFQPFRKRRFAEQSDRVTITASTGSIINPGDVASKPVVSITGSGNNTITIAGKAMSFTGLSGTVTVDCGAQMITKNGAVWTGSVSGEFWEVPLGVSSIAQTGSMSIQIDPEWRWL